MKTRNSIGGVKEHGKGEVANSPSKVHDDNNKPATPVYVRTLRSRVITSDTEDDVATTRRTPKSARKKTKENTESFAVSNTNNASKGVGCVDISPKSSRRRSAISLFRIEEIKEENVPEEPSCISNGEVFQEKLDCVLKIEKTPPRSKESEVSSSSPSVKSKRAERGSSHKHSSIVSDETANIASAKAVTVKKEEFSSKVIRKKALDYFLMDETMETDDTMLIKDDPDKSNEDSNEITRKNSPELPIQKELSVTEAESDENSDSDSDDMPEAVSFSSGKDAIDKELLMAAEAIKKEKDKRKEAIKKRMDMIKVQKAEKERKRAEKLKILKGNVPQRLAEDVVSSLSDKPDIPTVVQSSPSAVKRKNKEKRIEMQETPQEAKKSKIMKFDDYIPLVGVESATKFGVVPLDVTNRIPNSSSQKAAQFKYDALYGSRIQREPSKNLLMYRKKLAASGKL